MVVPLIDGADVAQDLLYERRHERGLYFDANTCQTHYPLNEVYVLWRLWYGLWQL